MNTLELEFLRKILANLPVPKKRYLKAALNTAVFWVFNLAGCCIAWFIISLIVSATFNLDIGISSIYSTAIFSISILLAALLSIKSTKDWLNDSVNEYALVKKDLTQRKVSTQTFTVQAVKCFKEPEFGGLLYILLLCPAYSSKTSKLKKENLNQSIRVIYDYESQRVDSEQSNLLTIKEKLTIKTAPHSQLVIDNIFAGEASCNIESYPLTAQPEVWPEPDSWMQLEWEELVQRYNPS